MIKVYSKAGCPQCESAKRLLDEWNIEYEVIRIDLDNDARNFLLGEGHRSVPQLYVGDKLLVEGGFPALRMMSSEDFKGKINE